MAHYDRNTRDFQYDGNNMFVFRTFWQHGLKLAPHELSRKGLVHLYTFNGVQQQRRRRCKRVRNTLKHTRWVCDRAGRTHCNGGVAILSPFDRMPKWRGWGAGRLGCERIDCRGSTEDRSGQDAAAEQQATLQGLLRRCPSCSRAVCTKDTHLVECETVPGDATVTSWG